MTELKARPPQADNHLKHGHARISGDSPTYTSWQSMLARCRYPNRDRDAKHINRGIRVCERWLAFANFLADMGERPAGSTLDRINNDGDYEPGNCRWATPREQARNRRNARLTFDSAEGWKSFSSGGRWLRERRDLRIFRAHRSVVN